MVNDNCNCRHGCMKYAEVANKIIPIGYDILNAMLIHDRCFAPIFSVTAKWKKIPINQVGLVQKSAVNYYIKNKVHT